MSEHFFFCSVFVIIDLVMVGGRQAPKDWCF